MQPLSPVLHDFHKIFARARAVELTEIDALPDTEQQLPVLDENGLARADGRAFQMRIRVPLSVPERRAVRERRVKAERQVMLHVRVGVLVDRDRAGRVRAENDRNAALNARLALTVSVLHDRSGFIRQVIRYRPIFWILRNRSGEPLIWKLPVMHHLSD